MAETPDVDGEVSWSFMNFPVLLFPGVERESELPKFDTGFLKSSNAGDRWGRAGNLLWAVWVSCRPEI